MINDTLYWMWLQNALGFGSVKINHILSRFHSILDFYESGLDFWISLSIFSKKELIKLSEPVEHFSQIYDRCKMLNYDIISLSSDKYPFLLKQISNPPILLYVKGNSALLNSKCVSIVGSRRASSYGVQMAFEISHNLSERGITIVSGGALGADSAAHRGSMSSHGSTICVLACGIDYPYLVQNEFLRNEISNYGALVSEYPPSHPIQSFNFPIRNRIISGLSYCTVIIEAGKKSGSLLTANIAADQGRDVYVVPVKFESYLSQGINDLISDGVKVVTSANDILNAISNFEFKSNSNIIHKKKESNSIKTINEFNNKDIKLDGNDLKIFQSIVNDKIHIDDIVKKTKLSVKVISPILLRLELMGLISSLPGKFYKKN